MMKKLLIFLPIILFIRVSASDLKINSPILYTDDNESYALVNLTWNNAWNNKKNHDAIWLFFKFSNGDRGYRHALVKSEGHTNIKSSEQQHEVKIQVANDRVGLFIYSGDGYRGDVSATLKIILDEESFKNVNTRISTFEVFGIEMVEIPAGGFFIGDPNDKAARFGSMYTANGNGDRKGLFELGAEDQIIEIGPYKDQLYYQAPDGYEGDQTGIIPAAFPKGVDAYYMMKYEPTQGQYVDFLNTLSESQSQHRANFGGKNYYENFGSIYIEQNRYVATNREALCNFTSWDDSMAFADWAGLRPMTEFEFTKAARGSGIKPINDEYPWGTSSKLALKRMINNQGEFYHLNDLNESQLNDSNKDVFGASYYWVMDLAGGLWERLITIGDSKGRSFNGTHGDGQIDEFGFANVKDWPMGSTDSAGYGYRGGGFYGYGRDYHDFNPYSPIAYRPYGAWSGGNRNKAYGARFVRTVK